MDAVNDILANLNKPKTSVTKEDVDNSIASVMYMCIPDTTITVCVITLHNGFRITGESSTVCPETFDVKIGEEVAYQNAYEKIWPYLGFKLKEDIYRQKLKNTVLS
jgi:hypothetical protein